MKYTLLFAVVGFTSLACGSGPPAGDGDTDGLPTESGGAGTGGLAPGAGGQTTGGASPTNGGAPSAGGDASPSSGGQMAGGSPTAAGGNAAAGGAGTSAGGSPETGGAPGAGGAPISCETSAPPAGVADWIDESWDAQLGANIESRKAWLLDNVMLGEGQLNLCVRWGATTAPTATVKQELASSVQDWFNDWFLALGNYDCFPYGEGISVKVTGWAVKPGNEGWVSDLGPEVAIYTETDGEGEPKCPDVCSFFSNWNHKFPNCPGGEAFHTDYWIWVDDKIPESGAAAVGGDWGLRMPVSDFVNSLGKPGSNVIEHEMGHGFGFQDYYDWTGALPEGGSLMVVGSQFGGVPTVGDTWLLRRTWSEMRALRNW
jgi:hypothetical protein